MVYKVTQFQLSPNLTKETYQLNRIQAEFYAVNAVGNKRKRGALNFPASTAFLTSRK